MENKEKEMERGVETRQLRTFFFDFHALLATRFSLHTRHVAPRITRRYVRKTLRCLRHALLVYLGGKLSYRVLTRFAARLFASPFSMVFSFNLSYLESFFVVF